MAFVVNAHTIWCSMAHTCIPLRERESSEEVRRRRNGHNSSNAGSIPRFYPLFKSGSKLHSRNVCFAPIFVSIHCTCLVINLRV